MSSSLGAMGPVLRKLDSLLGPDGSRLPKLLKSRIENLKQELLEDIVIPFVELSEEKAPDLTAKYWTTEVRELFYDIEDSIDEMIFKAHTAAATGSVVFSFRYRVRVPRKLKRSTPIAKVAKLTALVREAVDRHERYLQKDSPLVFSAQRQVTAQRGEVQKSPTRYGEAFNLVGMDERRIQLTNWIRCAERQTLEVIAIVGPGGIGKSTLAKELYHEHGRQFICRAFVRGSQKPNIRKLLWDILAQIQWRHQQPTRDYKVQNLIDNIRGHLQDKRYFIVIDDVWQTTVWDIILGAFPESNNRSRIIITTEMEDVALECCDYQSNYIFKMKPLGNVDSKKLFMNIVFGSEHQQSQKELDKASYEITRRSGGLPLAITIVSGLARFSAIQQTKLGTWFHIQNFLSTTLTCSGSEEMMKEILHFCYDNLPQHLKTCLLYLSMYPEGYIISKDDLVKQWMAEGFICTTQGKDEEEIAESYFNELINTRLIHPNRIKYIDGVISCTVHHMVLDMIKFKSKEANFTTVTDYPHITAGLSTKVRRLSLQLSSAKHASNPATVTMPQVRSLAFFGLTECLPLVASFKFKLIRVLIIEIWGEHDGWRDLTRISALFHLRYLKITSDVIVQLPDEMVGLQHLETFEVDARVSSVPFDIVDLPRLSRLRIKDETNLPDGISSIRSLHTLQYFDLAHNSEKNVQSLSKLSNLRDLHLACSTAGSEDHLKRNLDALSSSLGKLGDLCSLTLAPGASGTRRTPLEGSIIMSSVPVSIQRLKLLPPICIFSRLPLRMRELHKLRVLKIAVRELLRNDIKHLSELPALAVLCLHVRVARVGTVIIERGSFPALRYFQFRSIALSMAFRAGAMPSLQSLKLGFKAQTGKQYGRMLGGIEHLLNLQEITGEIAIATGAGETDQRAAHRAFNNAIEYSSRKWNAVSEHPSFPKVHVKLADWMVVEESFAHHEEGSGGLVTTMNRDPVCDKLPFPLDLLPAVISFTSPLDARRCSAVCTAFYAAASCDQVWDRFIPEDYRSILSRATEPVDFDFASTKKELFSILSEQPILINEGNKVIISTIYVDFFTCSCDLCDIIYYLSYHGVSKQTTSNGIYYRMSNLYLLIYRFEEVAELVDVCWLDIVANIDCRELSPNTRYTAYLVFNLTDRSYGLDSPTQVACINVAGAISRHTVSLYPRAQQQRSRMGSSAHYWLQDQWGYEVEDEDDEDDAKDYIEGAVEEEEDDDIEVEENEDEDDECEEKEEEENDIELEGARGSSELQDSHDWGYEVEDEDDEDEAKDNIEGAVEEEEDDDIEVEENEDEDDECEEKEEEENDIELEGARGSSELHDSHDWGYEVEDEDDEDEAKDYIEGAVEEEEDEEDDDIEVEENEDEDDECEEKEEEENDIELEGARGSNELQDSHEQDQGEEAVRYTRARVDGWMEVELGEFYIANLDDGAVEIRLIEHETLNWKSGLIVEGVEIRPVIGSDKRATTC
ncbi:putative disease resistance RPP13-like protein 2 [Dichanthelium oligosanthes]|uniref:Putative disease resistance RPP13-like protein 2 n=1 Tax=Dichanthelium oligosanthes TaxID=888268 RepID=A0A1E5VFA4_9POAL|nr:putative disease resistance RPP13-like protein 2 [Dichanthelium oligosanthes]